ncbi:MAG: prepilin-type N-terminal cleavage/methylation domain-containing protein [Burkholderiaceae bacterium]|nr:prepilin-type N-terminal cleavage/methylation domain-containing protein [Burkholderiaceae bacterium]
MSRLPPPLRPDLRHPPRGFTLLELLVAISVLAIVSMIAWRGLDSLIGMRERLQPESDEVRALLTAFGQLERDLAQITTPAVFGLRASPVAVRASTQGPVLEILRIAPTTTVAPTSVQSVFWRVADGQLLRQVSAPRRSFEAPEAEQLSNAPLLGNVRSMRVRLWRDVAWVDPLAPGAAEVPPVLPPGAPADLVQVPQGVEIIVERTDGRSFRRVLLVG